ncbi:N-6 DNA methylase [Paenibacillus sp. VCA1]|uniref:Eco57I restriction-modification methylase domain-containing protein n=1 Tax=Paenibacillus sp. VCA1 TaxID=3039148 RepID=UPI0028724EC3|nr:N-6 DNA methylase [Paenibacillus sp. VCA1]MDR9855633.1 N-6 DNA methylase [Paenibacillus sp. VCA1]
MEYTLEKLVENFRKNLHTFKESKAKYNEHSTRIEYIDPLLELLGWDVKNKKGLPPGLREVIPENYSKQGSRPDYTITVRGVKKFFVEAKKPSVDLLNEQSPALQARSYGVSAGHYISVLTNFEYLLIYDTTVIPNEKDDPRVALLKVFHFEEYISKWDEIVSLIGRNTVYSAKFEENFKDFTKNRTVISIDQYFLTQINEWRILLANDLFNKNPDYTLEYINDSIQDFINQMIFLRICEDRNLPTYHTLHETIKDENTLKDQLIEVLRNADTRYNSGLFSNNNLVLDLKNEIIHSIIESLYFPKSVFAFNVIEANILGDIYELFLAEKLVLTENGITLAKKDENLNRDIVSTPYEIVKYMVEKSLEPLCTGKKPEQILKLKIADIACGSGIFLAEIFHFLLEYIKQWYLENDKDHLIEGENGEFFLPFGEKRELLTSCVYGIDIDSSAVEVAKFSLLLKLLEGETAPTLGTGNKLLPSLIDNIKVGNSLVEYSYIRGNNISEIEKMELSPFDWKFRGEDVSFDAIICNPPYVATSDMKSILPSEEIKVYEKRYSSSFKQYDKYMIFLERAIQKVKEKGFVCFIIPNKFSKIIAGKNLRVLLTSQSYVREFIDFGSAQLFKQKNVTVYSSILLLNKEPNSTFVFEEVFNLQEWWANQEQEVKRNRVVVNSNIIKETPWVLVSDKGKAELVNKLYANASLLGEAKLADIFNGIQTSAERPVPIYWFSDEEIINKGCNDPFIKVERNGKVHNIEKSILKPFFKPTKHNEKNLKTYDVISPNKWIIFPYDVNGKLLSEEIMRTNYSGAWEYLLDHYDNLLPKQISGKKSGRDVPHANEDTWYHYGRIQALTRFINTPKLIVGILSKNPLYLYDDQDMLIASGGTAGYCAIAENLNSPYKLEFIQAVLTHPAIDWLCSIIGSDFDNDFYSRGTSVLQRLPIVNVNFQDRMQYQLYDEVISFTQRINQINKLLVKNTLDRKSRSVLDNEKETLIIQISDNVSELYGIKELMHVIK